jgi:hypothetical protein
MEKINKLHFKINKIYHYLFKERFNKKINFDFPQNINRWDLIQKLIDSNNFTNYLEIGCDGDDSFSKIKVENKIGVDPYSGGNFRGTSDYFFSENSKKFDCIFIDGLHEYNQVSEDIKNSLNVLNDNGIILLHDCLPTTLHKQAVPRYKNIWNGDVWKCIVYYRTLKNIDIVTCKIDQGISAVRKIKNKDFLDLNVKNFKELKFRDFYYNYPKYMRILEYKDFLEYIKN